VIQHQPHRAGTDLRRELVACLLAHGSTFSRVGASGKPGAVHSDQWDLVLAHTAVATYVRC
jgi:Holliday junction resolvase